MFRHWIVCISALMLLAALSAAAAPAGDDEENLYKEGKKAFRGCAALSYAQVPTIACCKTRAEAYLFPRGYLSVKTPDASAEARLTDVFPRETRGWEHGLPHLFAQGNG